MAREDKEDLDDDEEEELRGCWTETAWTWRILYGSAYTGSGVFAVRLVEFKEGDDNDDDDKDDDDDEILLSFSTTSAFGSADMRDGCRDFELMIEPYSVSDSSL